MFYRYTFCFILLTLFLSAGVSAQKKQYVSHQILDASSRVLWEYRSDYKADESGSLSFRTMSDIQYDMVVIQQYTYDTAGRTQEKKLFLMNKIYHTNLYDSPVLLFHTLYSYDADKISAEVRLDHSLGNTFPDSTRTFYAYRDGQLHSTKTFYPAGNGYAMYEPAIAYPIISQYTYDSLNRPVSCINMRSDDTTACASKIVYAYTEDKILKRMYQAGQDSLMLIQYTETNKNGNDLFWSRNYPALPATESHFHYNARMQLKKQTVTEAGGKKAFVITRRYHRNRLQRERCILYTYKDNTCKREYRTRTYTYTMLK